MNLSAFDLLAFFSLRALENASKSAKVICTFPDVAFSTAYSELTPISRIKTKAQLSVLQKRIRGVCWSQRPSVSPCTTSLALHYSSRLPRLRCGSTTALMSTRHQSPSVRYDAVMCSSSVRLSISPTFPNCQNCNYALQRLTVLRAQES